MYTIKNADFDELKKAFTLLLTNEQFHKLKGEEQVTIINAEMIFKFLEDEKGKRNSKIAKYIAEKRKTDRNYAR